MRRRRGPHSRFVPLYNHRHDTKCPPIYSQVRVGKWGEPFRIYRFRTMVSDSDNAEKYFTPEQLEVWKRERKVDNDPRITRLGCVLRVSSLDEPVQFLNVLLGQMSVVELRPITEEELNSHFTEAERAILLSVCPGITGTWRSGPRNEATFEFKERQRIELGHVRNSGLAEDMRCNLGTFGVMFGVRRSGR